MSDKIIGRNPVIEAIKADRDIDKIFISKGSEGSITKIIALARERIVVSQVERAKINEATQHRQRRCGAGFEPYYADVDDILKS